MINTYMSWFKKSSSKINWNLLTSFEELNEAIEDSNNQPIILFKHSTRCSISDMAKARLEDKWQDHFNIKAYYLDLIAYRNVSNEIAKIFNITHESPQVIVVNKQEVIINLTHNQITVQAILEKL